jgi:hypothetical protein
MKAFWTARVSRFVCAPCLVATSWRMERRLIGRGNKNACRRVTVIVAVRRQTSPAFPAFGSGSLCAQDLCKLLVNCELLENGWLSLFDS